MLDIQQVIGRLEQRQTQCGFGNLVWLTCSRLVNGVLVIRLHIGHIGLEQCAISTAPNNFQLQIFVFFALFLGVITIPRFGSEILPARG